MSLFDGRSFIRVAVHLSTSADHSDVFEAFYRSSIGRAYYACFHAFRAKHFPPEQWHIPREDGTAKYVSHWQLRRRIRENDSGPTADMFDTLIQLREHADYHSWKPTPMASRAPPPTCHCAWNTEAKRNSDYAMNLARTLLDSLDVELRDTA